MELTVVVVELTDLVVSTVTEKYKRNKMRKYGNKIKKHKFVTNLLSKPLLLSRKPTP